MDKSIKPKIVIISGLSGSGKSHALRAFEDCGYFCIDNLPLVLLPQFVDLSLTKNFNIRKSAVCVDIRERSFLEEFSVIYDNVKMKTDSIILFLEAKNDVLLQRFSETRRPHPLAVEGDLLNGILMEREQLSSLRCHADLKIDTSGLNVHQLKKVIKEQFDRDSFVGYKLPIINLVSFGFKYGAPASLDVILDVRFLANPYFDEQLRTLTGMDEKITDYIFSRPESVEYLKKVYDYFAFTVPMHEDEGRAYLSIGIGCTGGKHRSVAVSNKLKVFFEKMSLKAEVVHRDINK